MTETDIECGHTKTTLHAHGVNRSRKIITFSYLNSAKVDENYAGRVKSILVVLILQFASFVFFHHLYAWERCQVTFR